MKNRCRLFILSILLVAGFAQAEVPILINCQGRLFDGKELLNGDVKMSLRIYTNAVSGTHMYEDSSTVRVVDGVYSTYLGDDTSSGSLIQALGTGEAFLEVEANGIVFSPRERLVTVPYALVAERVVRIESQNIKEGSITPDKLEQSYWSTGGNATRSSEEPFIGTLDKRPFELRANNKAGLRIVPGADSPLLIGGHESNRIAPGSSGSAILGGGAPTRGNHVVGNYSSVNGGAANHIQGNYAIVGGGSGNQVTTNRMVIAGGRNNAGSGLGGTISGGQSNRVENSYAVIGGGYKNVAEGYVSSIGGGWGNTTTGAVSTVSGGQENRASGPAATIAGGFRNVADAYGASVAGGRGNQALGIYTSIAGGTNNVASGAFASVGGGSNNRADGDFSFAAGHQAHAMHDHTIVLSDGSGQPLRSTSENQILLRAANGVGIGTDHPSAMLDVAGQVRAATFIGDGSQLTGIKLDQINPGAITRGMLAPDILAQLKVTPGTPVDAALNARFVKLNRAGLSVSDGTPQHYSLGTEQDRWAKLFVRDQIDFDQSLSLTSGGQKFVTVDRLGNFTAPGLQILAGGSPSLIAGHAANSVQPGIVGATIGGGGNPGHANFVGGDFGTVAGGFGNRAHGFDASIAGGQDNLARGSAAFIGGGYTNVVTGIFGVIGGGANNQVQGKLAVVGGGLNNKVVGDWSVVPGGAQNEAEGAFSYAAGRQAKARHPGSFVWADASGIDMETTASNEFKVRASGGVHFFSDAYQRTGVRLAPGSGGWEMMSDRNAKKDFQAIDTAELLRRLEKIPMYAWTYKAGADGVRHIGPVAQDFYQAFGVGDDDRYINALDSDGVALAAIQGLYEMLKEKDAAIEALQKEKGELEGRLQKVEASMEAVIDYLQKKETP